MKEIIETIIDYNIENFERIFLITTTLLIGVNSVFVFHRLTSSGDKLRYILKDCLKKNLRSLEFACFYILVPVAILLFFEYCL